jgi:hypothetical protein
MRSAVLLPIVALLALAGCKREAAADNEMGGGPDEAGRYSGVGIYPADSLWNEIEGAEAANDAQAARLDDDSQVIVLVDRRTGEVRQCGNRSGFCVAMNPWRGRGRDKAPQLPAQLIKHASDLEKEAEAQRQADERAAAKTPSK